MIAQQIASDAVVVSVVMPVYNAERFLEDQMKALASQDFDQPWELVIVDNGSDDSSIDIIERYRPRFEILHLVSSSAGQGAAHARNVGVDASSGDLILSCDSDDVVGAGWVSTLSDALDNARLVAGRLDVELLNKPVWRRQRRAPQVQGLQKAGDAPPYAASSNMGFRRDVFAAIGGFDESLTGFSDTDFCWRAAESGIELVWVPDAVVHYRYRDNLGSVYRQAAAYSIARAELAAKHGFEVPDRTLSRNVVAFVRVLIATIPDLVLSGPARVAWKWGAFSGRVSRASRLSERRR